MPQTRELQQEWARIGAQARLQQIDRETAEIYAAFPELRGARRRGPASTSAQPARKLRTMSAAARRRITKGMRVYWAKRRAAEKK
jgi:hypothetical protein